MLPRVTPHQKLRLRPTGTSKAGTAVKADAIALVEMEDRTVAEWKILDSIDLS